VASAPAEPPKDLSLEQVQQAWPQVFGSMRTALGPRRQALFREATPGLVEGSTLELWVPGHLSFHLEQLQGDQEVLDLVANTVASVLGARPGVRFAARPDGAPAGSAPAPEAAPSDDPLPDKDSLEEAPDNVLDPASLLADLGAEVIEDVKYDR
jgi:hypothetical protein